MLMYIYIYSCASLRCQTVASLLAHWSTERSCVMTKSEESEYLKTKLQYYCWWKKSCTSWYGEYPIIYRVLCIPSGAGFLPSRVVTYTYTSNLINLISPQISLWSLGKFFQKIPRSFTGSYLRVKEARHRRRPGDLVQRCLRDEIGKSPDSSVRFWVGDFKIMILHSLVSFFLGGWFYIYKSKMWGSFSMWPEVYQ